METNFCPLVTNNIEIDTQGYFKPCCISDKRFKIDGKTANANNHSISDILQSDDRKQWIENFETFYKTDCSQCYEIEKSGGKSKRQEENLYWQNISKNKYVKGPLQSLDLKMGNVCNLACSICNSVSSSKWGSIDKQFGIHYVPGGRWFDTDQFWNELNNHVDKVERIELAGGEPFMIKKQKLLLDFLIERDLAKDIQITWFTNCTIWPEHLIEKFSKIKLAKIMLSIDNTHEKFEFQRWPAKWNETYEIFKKFIQARDDGLCQVEISHSVSALNILDLPDFHEWCHANNVRLYNNLVVGPYNAKDLPEEFKLKVIERFSKHTLKEPQINPVIGTDNYLVNLMRQPGDVSKLKYKLEYTRKTRPGLFEKAFPELAGYIDE